MLRMPLQAPFLPPAVKRRAGSGPTFDAVRIPMHEYQLLEILAMGFALALLFGYLAHRLGLSPIVGYLLAGFFVGPQSPGFVADMNLAAQLSEAGVILLMFGVGLHFNMDDLLAVKGVAIPGAILQSAAATICGVFAGTWFGLPLTSGIMLGLGLSVASTVVLLRVLTDNNVLSTVHGHVAVGWLVVEDLFTVLILVMLPSVAGLLHGAEGVGPASVAWAIGGATLRLVALWVLVLVVGGRVVPWLLLKVVRTRSQELFTLTVLVAAFATAVGSAVFFQASMALGAFLGGMVVGKSSVSHQAGVDLLPMRDAFSVLFFLSVGMLFSPVFLMDNMGLVAVCLFIVLAVKPLAALVGVALLGYSTRTALTVATSLAQVGEFSFILAQQAQALKLIPNTVYNVLVVCGMISITLNPSVFRLVPVLENLLRRSPRLWRLLNARADKKALGGNDALTRLRKKDPSDDRMRAIVVGYGPTGQSVIQILKKQGIVPVTIDMNADTVNTLSMQGLLAIFGDASRREILHAAGVEKAGYLVITIPILDVTTATATMAISMNPNLRVLARARFLADVPLLRSLGLVGIAVEEEEVAASLSSMLLADVQKCQGEAPGRCTLAGDALPSGVVSRGSPQARE